MSLSPSSPQERLIVALDVPDFAAALQLVNTLGDSVSFYKIGLELFAAGDGRRLIDKLKQQNKRIFADLKLFDVPETVARATRQIAESGADFLTVHGNDDIMTAAAENKKHLGILAVTVLTSLDQGDMQALGFQSDLREVALSRAQRALALGCDGAVCSGLEVAALRQQSPDIILVTPGVRPAAAAQDDQKRVATPGDIIKNGGDYLVVGRPVRNAASPRQAADDITKEIAAAL